MLLTKEVEIKPNGKMIQYYKDKGYDAKRNQPLMVKIEDLSMCSTVLVETKCDYCGKDKLIKYVNYNAQTKNGTQKCCCLDCASLKQEEIMLEKYGYKSPIQVPEFKTKIQETNKERHGSISPTGNKIIREKQKKTLMSNYGVVYPSQSEEIRDKVKQTNLKKYGVECVLKNENVKEKIKQTNLNCYGAENVLLNQEIRDKRNATLMKNFGTLYPLQNEECFEKLKETNMTKYGVENISQLEDVKQKKIQASLEKYGYKNPMQSPEFLEKWFLKNGSNFVRTSKQQRYLCGLYNGILNQPFKCFALDIYLADDKLDIEFDGSGHRMSIAIGNVTEKEFNNKELYRNIALKREGYKQMRIISTHDLLPSDQVLLQMLSDSRKYFSDYPNHSWIEFNIDLSVLRNAEHKDGILYNYGELRTIKEAV